MKPTVTRLRELFHYEPESGKLIRKVTVNNFHARKGDEAGCLSKGYLRVRVDGNLLMVHQIVWAMQTGKWPEKEIDHINGKRNDNRWSNLRLLEHSTNNRNQPWNTTQGVYWDDRVGKWVVRMGIHYRNRYFGQYKTRGFALAVRQAAERVLMEGGDIDEVIRVVNVFREGNDMPKLKPQT